MDENGILQLDFRQNLSEKPNIVSNHVSNALGIINPIEEYLKSEKNSSALMMIDGAQSVPHFRD